MKAQVRLIYSSEGASPEEIDRRMTSIGFQRSIGIDTYESEIADASELAALAERLHGALAGAKVRYIPVAKAVQTPVSAGQREAIASLASFGVDVTGLDELADTDPETFRTRVIDGVSSAVDAMLAERDRARTAAEARRAVEGAKDRIIELADKGSTAAEMLDELELDSDIVFQLLEDLVDRGIVTAEQRGRNVVYVRA